MAEPALRLIASVTILALLLSCSGSPEPLGQASQQPATDGAAAVQSPPSGTKHITVRVINDSTGEPVAFTECALLRVDDADSPSNQVHWDQFEPDSDWSPSGFVPRMRTNADGMLQLPLYFWPAEDDDDRPVADRLRLEGLYPLPPDFAPVTASSVVAEYAVRALSAPANRPLQVRVRPLPCVRGRIVDRAGMPVSHAGLMAFAYERPTWLHGGVPEIGQSVLGEVWRDAHLKARELAMFRVQVLAPHGATDVEAYAAGTSSADLEEALKRFPPLGTTNADGEFSVPLPPGRWLLQVWHSTHGLMEQHVEHGHADTPVEWRMLQPMCTVTARFNLLLPRPTDDGQPLLRLKLNSIAPDQSPDNGPHGEEDLIWMATIDPRESTSVTVRISGIAPHWWGLAAGWAWSLYEWHLLSPPGESRELTLDLGAGEAQFIVDPATAVPEDFTVAVRRAASLITEHWSVTKAAGSRVTLPPGHYVASFAGAPEVPFRVTHGGLTLVQLTVPMVDVDFTLDTHLRDLLSGQDALRLSVLEDGTLPRQFSLDHQDGLQHLTDGTGLNWQAGKITLRLPQGVYAWSLGLAIHGVIDLRQPSMTVRFARNSLPGLEANLLTLAADHRCVVTLQRSGIWRPLGTGRLWRGKPRTQTLGGAVALDQGGTRWMVFAPRGVARVHIECNGVARLTDLVLPGNTSLDLRVPLAKVQIRAWQDASHVHVLSESAVHSFSAEDLAETRRTPAPLQVLLPPGRYRYHVLSNSRVAAGSFDLGPDGLLLDLSNVEGEPAGTLRFAICATVHSTQGLENLAGLPVVSRLVRATPFVRRIDGPMPLDLDSIWADCLDLEWGTRDLRLHFAAVCLPAGTYRIEPWPGAPEELCPQVQVPAPDPYSVVTIHLGD